MRNVNDVPGLNRGLFWGFLGRLNWPGEAERLSHLMNLYKELTLNSCWNTNLNTALPGDTHHDRWFEFARAEPTLSIDVNL